MSQNTYTVFSKPWKTESIAELGEKMAGMGYDGIELPVRPGFQVEPESVSKGLPAAAKRLAEAGITINSVAGPTDEATIAACAETGVPIIRTMASLAAEETYLEAEDRYRRQFDALVPLLDKYGVTVGIQNHYARFVANAIGLMRLIGDYDPKHFAAVWDPGHEALEGNSLELAIDIVWSRLCMVNLKNAFWRRTNGPEAEYAEWRAYWTSGRQGLASWPRVATHLKRRGWKGVLCLTAEYSDHLSVERLAVEDLAFARSLFS